MQRADTELLTRIAHAGETDADVRAAALVRIIADVEKDGPSGLRFVRLDGDAAWILQSDDIEQTLRRLGATADELAARAVVAGPFEARRALVEVAVGTPLGLPPERLVPLAAAASRRAAASSRLEVYPRGTEARRTVELSSAVLTSDMTEDDLRRRVAARYPGAAPLSPRPGLDDLVAAFGLRPDLVSGLHVRGRDDGRSSLHTSVRSPTTFSALRSASGISARDVAVGDFDDQVRLCLERRTLLVLGVSSEREVDAERALARGFGLVTRSFHALFLAEVERTMAPAT